MIFMDANNNLKKILFYISTIREGGAARVMVNLANQFSKVGYEVLFITNFPAKIEYPLSAKIKRISLEKEESKQNIWNKNISRIRALRDIIDANKPKYCIAFMMQNNVRLLLATLFTGVKTIISIRTDPKRKYSGIKGYLIGKIFYRLADGVVFQTKEAQAYFPCAIQKKSAIIWNPVSDKFYQTTLSENPHNIVTCGRLSGEKRQALLIRAFANIAHKFPTDNLLIYGQGPKENALRQLIGELKLQNRVFLMGQSRDIAKVLGNAKLFVLASSYEGMPNALMEALTVGVPSISTDCPCGGPHELITPKYNGLLIPCDEEKALIHAMDAMLSNPKQAVQMGENARKVAQSYRTDMIAQEWEKLLRRI